MKLLKKKFTDTYQKKEKEKKKFTDNITDSATKFIENWVNVNMEVPSIS